MYFGYPDMGEVSSCSELMKELTKKYIRTWYWILFSRMEAAWRCCPPFRNYIPTCDHDIFHAARRYLCEGASAIWDPSLCQQTMQEEEMIRLLVDFCRMSHRHRILPSFPVRIIPSPTSRPRVGNTALYPERHRYNEIASALNLKWNTISTVKNRIFEKTNTGNVIELKDLATLYKVN